MDLAWVTQGAAYGAFVLIFVAGVLLGVLFASRPWRYLRIFRNFFRILTTPLRGIGLMGKASRRFKSARNAAVTSKASISILDRKTEIEKIIFLQRHGLFRPGEDVELDESQLLELERKSEELERSYLVRRKGLLFNEIDIPSTYTPDWMSAGLSPETVAEFRANADAFFSNQVDLSANNEALYEDVDGAHSIAMFGSPGTDLAAYNLINEARKNINANVLRLILAFVVTTLASLAVILFVTRETIWSLAPIIVGALIMALLQIFYSNKQRHSIRALGKFMNLYVGYISDRFRDVTGKALGVTVGNEKDAAVLAENAKIWNKLLIWMAFRAFFIETFLRNQLYQIHRNSGYYELFSNTLIVAVIPLVVFVGHAFGLYNLSVYVSDGGRIVAAAALFLAVVYLFLTHKKVITEELSFQDWRGFDKLQLSAKMDEVVGKYAEEIGYWKQRLDR